MSGVWVCHLCRNVNHVAHTPACLNCCHARCPLCPTRPLPSTPAPSPAPAEPIAPADSQIIMPTSSFNSGRPANAQSPRKPVTSTSTFGARAAPQPPQARPSTQNWWKCCQCKQAYNPDLVPDKCPHCDHGRCSQCKTLTA